MFCKWKLVRCLNHTIPFQIIPNSHSVFTRNTSKWPCYVLQSPYISEITPELNQTFWKGKRRTGPLPQLLVILTSPNKLRPFTLYTGNSTLRLMEETTAGSPCHTRFPVGVHLEDDWKVKWWRVLPSFIFSCERVHRSLSQNRSTIFLLTGEDKQPQIWVQASESAFLNMTYIHLHLCI